MDKLSSFYCKQFTYRPFTRNGNTFLTVPFYEVTSHLKEKSISILLFMGTISFLTESVLEKISDGAEDMNLMCRLMVFLNCPQQQQGPVVANGTIKDKNAQI